MKTKIINFAKDNGLAIFGTIILILCSLVLTLTANNSDKNNYIEKQNKILTENKSVNELTKKIKVSNRLAEGNLSTIDELKERISVIQVSYETNVLESRCYENQLLRQVKNEQLDQDYCKVTENLEQFRSVKLRG